MCVLIVFFHPWTAFRKILLHHGSDSFFFDVIRSVDKKRDTAYEYYDKVTVLLLNKPYLYTISSETTLIRLISN